MDNRGMRSKVQPIDDYMIDSDTLYNIIDAILTRSTEKSVSEYKTQGENNYDELS